GAQLVQETGATMDAILRGVTEVTTIMKQIASASEEQSKGISQPPFDTEFIYATYILERAEEEGTLIVNKPQSLRDCNEKLYTAW
ncbi:hypothetical protein MJO10_31095, partial [Salmonella enterica subsp. enterica serovar Anatum]|nr:hypothetical protein [Salmonella enterica subsp. enterica serovar Anatum]